MAEVYLFGGVCTSWKTGGRDVLYVRPDAKFDKSKPISVRRLRGAPAADRTTTPALRAGRA